MRQSAAMSVDKVANYDRVFVEKFRNHLWTCSTNEQDDFIAKISDELQISFEEAYNRMANFMMGVE